MWVSIRTVPMGWVGAVDVMQSVARRRVFEEAEVPAETEMLKGRPFPAGSEGPAPK